VCNTGMPTRRTFPPGVLVLAYMTHLRGGPRRGDGEMKGVAGFGKKGGGDLDRAAWHAHVRGLYAYIQYIVHQTCAPSGARPMLSTLDVFDWSILHLVSLCVYQKPGLTCRVR
jgi:hypothetical protein